jgi:uronate dehydrogenase
MRVLVTGSNGHVGRRLTAALRDEYEVVAGDLDALDVTRFESVRAAMAGVEAVIHLAVASGREGEEEDAAFNQLRFDVNVKGTWNVLEAARLAGVRRVVHTSSLMVVWGHPPPAAVASDAPAAPVGTYALTKHLAEQMCEYFARQHRLSIVCLRIPKPIDLDDPLWKRSPIRPQWIAFPDLIQAYRLALAAPDVGFEVVTVVGESSRRRWDLAKAQRVLGYRPTMRLEDLGYRLGDEREPYP